MKKNIRIVAALLALMAALSVEASPVLERDAQYAAKGWGILNSKAFGALGEAEGVTAETNAAGNVQWYVVKMTKGAVVVAPDDEIEPVIAVLPNSNGVIPEGSSLRVMLERDMANRLAGVSGAGGKLKLTTSSASSATAPKETAKWNKLRQYGRGRVLKTSAVGEDPATIVRRLDGWNSDSKVDGVQTLRFWDQEGSEDYFTNPSVFNFYTPGHAPCGCVATAGSSVIHYFRVPSGNVLTRDCTYNGAGVELTTKGGTYDWTLIDSVNLKRGSTVTLSDAAVDLLGRVAYDCGVGCQMDYGDAGSGSWTKNLMQSFRNVFNMANVQLVTQNGTMEGPGDGSQDIGPANYAKLIYNQIRGGAPVVLGIYMHEVVAVGYGYDDDRTDYTYVFTGWGGYNDAWYALPTIDTKATPEGGTYTSTFVDELITEIAPFDNKFIAVVGQVVDADGEPVPSDRVTMSNGEVVTTDENGFFGTRVSPLDPQYVTDSFGEEHEYELGNAAMRTTNSGLPSGTLAAALPEAMVVELLEPSVRVGGDDNRIYGSLTKALQCVMPRETVEILKPTIFKKSVTVPTSCTIFATNAVASETAVRHANDAIITVPDGVTVSISNVCFKTAAGEPVITAPQLFDVEAGGTLRLSCGCRMGPIKTARADGLVVANELTDSLYVTCAAAMGEGKAFAKYATDYETAAKCAHFLRHPSNTRLGGAADKNGNIIWSRNAPVADDIAVAKTVIGGTSRNYLAMDDIIEDVATLTEPVEIVVIKDGALTRKYTLKSSAVTIRGEGAEKPVLTTATTAGFVIGSGTSLTLANVTFAGTKLLDIMKEACFAYVNGGSMTLSGGAELNGITGNVSGRSGVIDLIKGTVTTEEGSVIANCAAEGVSGCGGAIFVRCTGCTLNLDGGSITNCHSAMFGGGVYLESWKSYVPTVNVSGKLTVADNWSANFKKTDGAYDDIYLASENNRTAFKLSGKVDGKVGIRYSATAGCGNSSGDAFMTVGGGAAADETTLYSFFSDATAGLVAAKGTGKNAGKLVWAADTRDPRQCDESEAAAKLIDGGRVTFWREVSDALNEATDDSVVEVLKEQTLASDVDISGRVVLRTSGAELTRLSLVRAKDVSISIPDGSELSVTHVDFNGYNSDGVSCTPLFAVGGGVLKIDDVLIRDVTGGTNRNANAVTVFSGGTFEMRNSQISSCWNDAVDPSGAPEKTSNAGAGGGLLVDNATAYLRDSSIVNCRATWGGGAFACNGSTVYISGDVRIADNTASGAPSNLMASDTSSLVLAGALTGVARVSNLEYSLEHPGMTNVVAAVSDEWKWTVTSLTNSAASFERDLDGAPAVAVTNGANALIVWCGAVKDGVYVNVEDDKPVAYALVGEMPVVLPALLPALTSESGVSGALARMSDARVGAKIATLGEYNKFRAWADGVDGGKESVAESDKAYVSYQFGTTSLLESDPTVEISEIENAEDGLRVSVIVKDGEDPVAVAAANVAKMFEATSDLGDWTKKVELAVTDPVPNGDGSVTFTVKPAGAPAAAFIRLAY